VPDQGSIYLRIFSLPGKNEMPGKSIKGHAYNRAAPGCSSSLRGYPGAEVVVFYLITINGYFFHEFEFM